MDRHFGTGRRYTTNRFQDDDAGSAGVELLMHTDGRADLVARVVFWDACGDFFLEMKRAELPVAIVEELIAEARAALAVR